MDIPLLEGGLERFQNPNFLARLIHLSDSFWTWGALILAAVAAFSSAIRRTKLVILRHRKRRSLIRHPSFRFSANDDDSCSSSDDEEDEDEDEDEEKITSEEEDEEKITSEEEDELALCSGDEQGQNSKSSFWPEIWRGGAIVKAWEGMGLRLDRSGSSGSISLVDLNRDEVLLSFLAEKGQIPAVTFASPAVVLSANARESGGATATVRVWDARGGGQGPVAAGEWRTVLRRRVVGVARGGDGKVYVSDDVGSVAAVDLRSFRSPSGTTWWDADAVMVGDGEDL